MTENMKCFNSLQVDYQLNTLTSLPSWQKGFNSLQVDYQRLYLLYKSKSQIWFQFLIGRLSTRVFLHMINLYQFGFNSLQVDYQQIDWKNETVLVDQFQFLIGRLSTETVIGSEIQLGSQFQFLIGRLSTNSFIPLKPTPTAFQFLIGRLSTHQLLIQTYILLRFNSLQVDYQLASDTINFISLEKFQFLIGRLSTQYFVPFSFCKLEFQFLIGRLSTKLRFFNCSFGLPSFQFLIGRLSTTAQKRAVKYFTCVSIPYRQTINFIIIPRDQH